MRNPTLILLLVTSLSATAQTLPGKQTKSVWAPANVKIDGKAEEWNNQFQANNSATDLCYTLSNDSENLYLIVQASQPRIIQKIMIVGIDFIINTKNKKDTSAKAATTITFPQISPAASSKVLAKAGIKTLSYSVSTRGTSAQSDPDTSILLANNLFINAAKEIKVKGAKIKLPDTLISVYNEDQFRAAARFDNQKRYNYELSVPLKALGLSANTQQQTFSYSLRLQSRLVYIRKGGITVAYRYGPGGSVIDPDQDLNSTTNFWGEYTLAKAP